jgi:uncharacterized protein YndB with AHSA1/START domain
MKIRRSRRVGAPPEDVWRTVGDPHHLPRWWPRVDRVEAADGRGFTEVLRSGKGASVRADFRIVQRREPDLIAWDQDVEGTPFERMMRAARTSIVLAPAGGETEVRLELDIKLAGMARLGGPQVRRALGRQLDEALTGLAGLHG